MSDKPCNTHEREVASAGAITVWAASVAAVPDALWPRLEILLDAAEQERAKRFRFERDCRHYWAAHALKRLMLTRSTGGAVVPQAWTFDTGPHGRPAVARGGDVHFNLSHCAGLVACAVSRAAEPGIDVESLDRAVPWDVAEAYFAADEAKWLDGLPAKERQAGFLRLWTLKEAYIKATGLGLSQPLKAFAIGFDPLRISFTDPALGDPSTWRFEQMEIDGRYVLALAWRAPAKPIEVEVTSVNLESLLEAAVHSASEMGYCKVSA
jgi:4'-phosphopantetheinyl transferase